MGVSEYNYTAIYLSGLCKPTHCRTYEPFRKVANIHIHTYKIHTPHSHTDMYILT